MSYVIATAGHVDHGKSTLVRALTGIEPDRWAEEKRRGLTIDLGFAWTKLPSGREISFVDVPGHERFLGNMLAGLGPAPVVCFVVAADEGWQAQSSDHRDAVAALGIRHGVIVLTRTDRAPGRVDDVVAQVRAELAGTGLGKAPVVPVSAVEGTGLEQLRATLDTVLDGVPTPSGEERVRLWVDRAFTIKGAGAVVTGTLGAGRLVRDQPLTLLGHDGARPVTIRGLQSHSDSLDRALPTSRVAANLRGVSAQEIHRGDVLIERDAWPLAQEFDIRRTTGPGFSNASGQVVVHIGTASVPARLRPFDDDHARLRLDRVIPVVPGDRLVLRYPGGAVLFGGALVLDVDTQELRRRGDSARQAAWLRALPDGGDATALVKRLDAVPRLRLQALGLLNADFDISTCDEVIELAGWWVHQHVLQEWVHTLRTEVERIHARTPLAPGMPLGTAHEVLAITDAPLVKAVIQQAGLNQSGGYLSVPEHRPGLGAAEGAVATLERRFEADPFDAPEAYDLDDLGLGPKELAAAERMGRILRLGDGVVVGPKTPAQAMRALTRLDQPFTTSQARQAWGTTRRVAIPLLEHLDTRGWTVREDGTHRRIKR